MPPTAAAAAAHPPGPRALRSPSPPLGVGGVALHHPSSHPRDAASLRPPTSPALSPARAPASRAPDSASYARDEQQRQVPLSAAPPLLALALWLLPPGCFRQPLPRRAPHPPPPHRDQDPKRMPHTAEAAAHPPWIRPARPPPGFPSQPPRTRPARPPLPQPSPSPGMGGSALRHPASHLKRRPRSAPPPHRPSLRPGRPPAAPPPCASAANAQDVWRGQVPLSTAPPLLALALLLIPPGCFRQSLPLRAPHPPPPPRDQDPERTPHTAEAAAHPPSPWPSPARLPAPPAQPASGSGGMWGLVLSHLASHY
jgi:hypothetical protein